MLPITEKFLDNKNRPALRFQIQNQKTQGHRHPLDGQSQSRRNGQCELPLLQPPDSGQAGIGALYRR